MTASPVVRPVDHLRVVGLLLRALLGMVPLVLWILLSPVLRPWVRGRLRRRLLREDEVAVDEPPEPRPEAWAGREVFVVAGEASGDRLAARVVAALKARCPDLRVRGYAGPATRAAGATLDREITQHAVVGVTAVARSLGTWWELLTHTLALWREEPPDVLLTVDFPGLNGALAGWARRRGVKTVHLVPPAVWAWAPWRLVRWRRAVDRMLTVFPFEKPIFEGSGISCVHVGHPLFEAPLPPPRTASRPSDDAWVELLPGSRRQEIRGHAAPLVEAAARIGAGRPGTRFVVRLAEDAHRGLFEEAAAAARERPDAYELRVGEPAAGEDEGLLGAVAASGTVTAELGVALVPHVLFYRVSPLGRFGAWVGLTAPWIGLVNLIARREVARERLLVRPRGRRLGDDFLETVADPARWSVARATLQSRVRAAMEVEGVADRAARAVLDAGGHAPRNHRPVGESSTSSSPAGGPA